MNSQFSQILSLATLVVLTSIACKTAEFGTADDLTTPIAPSRAGYSFRESIALDSFGVVGIAAGANGTLWLADADNNRLVRLTPDGRLLDTLGGFDRPMHIARRGDQLLVAEYGADRITAIAGPDRRALPFPDAFDAPSGIDVDGERQVVADFYNHRVVYTEGGRDRSFGTKGDGPGELTYPTDVQLAHDKIWVADAYNHRVQVFDLDGGHLLTFGETEAMNAATGLYVGEDAVFVTDFENSRVLVYDLSGSLRGTLTEGLDKPTDVLAAADTLYVVNYGGRTLATFTKS